MTIDADFLTAYEALATALANQALAADIQLNDKADILKALTPFYVQKMKHMKDIPDKDDMPTFGDFSSQIHAEN